MFAALAAILYAIAIAMVAGGAYLAGDGAQMFPADRAVAQFIAGSGIATGGGVLFGIATLILCMGFLNRTLKKIQAGVPAMRAVAADDAQPIATPAAAVATAAAAVASTPVLRDITGAARAPEPSLDDLSVSDRAPLGAPVAESESGVFRTLPEIRTKQDRDGEDDSAKSGEALQLASGEDPLFEPAAPEEQEPVAGPRGSAFGYSYDNAPVRLSPLSAHRSPLGEDRALEEEGGVAALPDEQVVATETPAGETALPPVTEEPETAPVVVGSYESGGNRYVMYSDGSIEAHMPGGTRTFRSLDELKQFISTLNPA